MKELEYPFDSEYIIRKKKSIKRELLSQGEGSFQIKKIALLGGVTTRDILLCLELFLLNNGIKPEFYESEYNQYYEDGMFPNEELEKFAPDIIYVCTSNRNIDVYPNVSDSKEVVLQKQENVIAKFKGLWASLAEKYNCPIIQNNFEYPFYRLLGNKDASDYHGRVNFLTKLNCDFYDYAQNNNNFYICDINYISASYGLDKWSDPYYWYMYKYAVAVPAIPLLASNVANIIKSLFGKNKKALNLDLDNTLWGGIIGDDGAENIEIGQETSIAQTYSEFQEYIKLQKQIGILLTVNSKNDMNNAVAGFDRPDTVLTKDDFVKFKANWNPKSQNLIETANELNILPDSFVFVDDNPAERAIIEEQVKGAAIAKIETPEHYIQAIDHAGYFEVTNLSEDDTKRNEMYQENAKREQALSTFVNYEDYLRSLEMKAEIKNFSKLYMARIAQLTNKSNQFNLTTRRYTQSELEEIAADKKHITLYGKLADKFGDNGVVSVAIGRIDGEKNNELHMELWLMSCRVLKRDMEHAMMDELVNRSREKGIQIIYGYYYPTAKNTMVKDFYDKMGFIKFDEDIEGNTKWKLDITANYQNKQKIIEIEN